MKVAILLQDQEAAGKTGPACIQVSNRKLARKDYHKYLRRHGIPDAEFLKEAVTFCDGAACERGSSLPHVLVTDAPVAERQGEGTNDSQDLPD